MPKQITKVSRSAREFSPQGKHRYEHWQIDNQIYFITARCRDKFPALASEQAKQVFWIKFEQYAHEFTFEPWVTSLLDNHYHTIGFLRTGANLRHFIQRLHGSVAKLVNDLLLERRAEFWRDMKGKEYFDGCLRDELQGTRTYRYVYTQCRRHGVCDDPHDYPHTRVYVAMDEAIASASANNAFLRGVPYPRYFKNRD